MDKLLRWLDCSRRERKVPDTNNVDNFACKEKAENLSPPDM